MVFDGGGGGGECTHMGEYLFAHLPVVVFFLSLVSLSQIDLQDNIRFVCERACDNAYSVISLCHMVSSLHDVVQFSILR